MCTMIAADVGETLPFVTDDEKETIRKIREEKEANVVVVACDILDIPLCYAKWSDRWRSPAAS